MCSSAVAELMSLAFPEGAGSDDSSPFTELERSLARIDSDDLQELSTDELRARYVRLASLSRAAEAIGARCLAEIDRRDQLTPEPGSSPSWWLQDTLNLTANAAYAQLRTARQLEGLSETARAFRQGQLSAQHVAIICRAMEDVRRTRLEPAGVEPALVEAGRRMNPLELQRQWGRLRYQADQEAGVEAEREQRERRWGRC